MLRLVLLLAAVTVIASASGLSSSDADENQEELIMIGPDSPLMVALNYRYGNALHRLRRSTSTRSRPCVQTKQWPPPPCL